VPDVGGSLGLLVLEDHFLTVGLSQIRVTRGGELGELATATFVGVIDEETSVVGVVGVEGQTEHALLDTPGQNLVRQIEEGGVEQGPRLVQDPDDTQTLDDEEAIVTRRSGEGRRLLKTVEDLVECDFLQGAEVGTGPVGCGCRPGVVSRRGRRRSVVSRRALPTAGGRGG
jgi:hypothetical protein